MCKKTWTKWRSMQSSFPLVSLSVSVAIVNLSYFCLLSSSVCKPILAHGTNEGAHKVSVRSHDKSKSCHPNLTVLSLLSLCFSPLLLSVLLHFSSVLVDVNHLWWEWLERHQSALCCTDLYQPQCPSFQVVYHQGPLLCYRAPVD